MLIAAHRSVKTGAWFMNKGRRQLITWGVWALAAAPDVKAQRAGTAAFVVGVLGVEGQTGAQAVLAAFRQEMQRLGFHEGRNLTLVLRFAEGQLERVPALAQELVSLRPHAILSFGTVTTKALQKLTDTIPIVMGNSPDPVAAGFVKSLAHPGGNITGLSNIGNDTGAKHLGLLLAAVPGISRVAVLMNPGNPANLGVLNSITAAAQGTSASIVPVRAGTAAEIDKAFAAMAEQRADAVIVMRDGLYFREEGRIVALALARRLPSIAGSGGYARAGGLLS
jgi:putative tryptophan/tyrosine transport system substrate-binding protein